MDTNGRRVTLRRRLEYFHDLLHEEIAPAVAMANPSPCEVAHIKISFSRAHEKTKLAAPWLKADPALTLGDNGDQVVALMIKMHCDNVVEELRKTLGIKAEMLLPKLDLRLTLTTVASRADSIYQEACSHNLPQSREETAAAAAATAATVRRHRQELQQQQDQLSAQEHQLRADINDNQAVATKLQNRYDEFTQTLHTVVRHQELTAAHKALVSGRAHQNDLYAQHQQRLQHLQQQFGVPAVGGSGAQAVNSGAGAATSQQHPMPTISSSAEIAGSWNDVVVRITLSQQDVLSMSDLLGSAHDRANPSSAIVFRPAIVYHLKSAIKRMNAWLTQLRAGSQKIEYTAEVVSNLIDIQNEFIHDELGRKLRMNLPSLAPILEQELEKKKLNATYSAVKNEVDIQTKVEAPNAMAETADTSGAGDGGGSSSRGRVTAATPAATTPVPQTGQAFSAQCTALTRGGGSCVKSESGGVASMSAATADGGGCSARGVGVGAGSTADGHQDRRGKTSTPEEWQGGLAMEASTGKPTGEPSVATSAGSPNLRTSGSDGHQKRKHGASAAPAVPSPSKPAGPAAQRLRLESSAHTATAVAGATGGSVASGHEQDPDTRIGSTARSEYNGSDGANSGGGGDGGVSMPTTRPATPGPVHEVIDMTGDSTEANSYSSPRSGGGGGGGGCSTSRSSSSVVSRVSSTDDTAGSEEVNFDKYVH